MRSTRDVPLEAIVSVGVYDGPFREVIHALKYQSRRSLASHLAGLMRERGRPLLDRADCVVPVPLHWRRHYTRGFNQAAALASHLGPPMADILVRSRATRSQIQLSKNQREANVRNAFALKRNVPWRRDIKGMCVVLIDDVVTTGATLEACAAVLISAGAARVSALTAARKL
jgi:ComF family protein